MDNTSMMKDTDSASSKLSRASMNQSSSDIEIVWAKFNSITKKTVPSVRIRGTAFSIGRHPSNDLQIVNARLSGQHCKLSRTHDKKGKMKVFLTDLSTNGTFVNGKIVSKHTTIALKTRAKKFIGVNNQF